jgi:hypothetical protein
MLALLIGDTVEQHHLEPPLTELRSLLVQHSCTAFAHNDMVRSLGLKEGGTLPLKVAVETFYHLPHHLGRVTLTPTTSQHFPFIYTPYRHR